MKTKYDWLDGARGRLLVPEGSTSVSLSVSTDVTAIHDVLEELHRDGRLTGTALFDAEVKYGKRESESESESEA